MKCARCVVKMRRAHELRAVGRDLRRASCSTARPSARRALPTARRATARADDSRARGRAARGALGRTTTCESSRSASGSSSSSSSSCSTRAVSAAVGGRTCADARSESRRDAGAHRRRIAVRGLQLRRHPRDVLAQLPNVARIAERGPRDFAAQRRPERAVQEAQQAALAGAVRAGHEPVLAGHEPPADVVQHAAPREPDVGVLERDQRHCGRVDASARAPVRVARRRARRGERAPACRARRRRRGPQSISR